MTIFRRQQTAFGIAERLSIGTSLFEQINAY